MRYKVNISNKALKQLKKLPDYTRELARQAIRRLADEPRPLGCLKLKVFDEWRVRINDYRIIYEIHDDVLVVLVVRVEHRSKAYRVN